MTKQGNTFWALGPTPGLFSSQDIQFTFSGDTRDGLLSLAHSIMSKTPFAFTLCSIVHDETNKVVWRKSSAEQKTGWTKDADKVLSF